MSNSRKMKRSIKRNVSITGAGIAGVGMVGLGLIVVPGTAFAATELVPTATTTSPTTPANVYPGLSNQPVNSVTMTITNSFAATNTIDVAIEPNGYANGQSATGSTGTAANAVTFSTTPTVTVTAAKGDATTDTAPTFTASLTTNPNDSASDLNSAIKDELVLTATNYSTGTATDTYTITLSGIEYNVGASAGTASGGVPVYVNDDPTNTTTAVTSGNNVVENAVVQNYQLTETPTGVPMGSTGTALSNFALKETIPGTFPAGAQTIYTLKPTGGTAAAGKFTGSATVTATGFTVAALTSTGTCPTTAGSSSASLTANAAGQLQFCVLTPTTTTTGPGSLTISGMTYVPAGGPGTDTVTLSDNSTTNTTTWATAQAAVTIVANPTIAGYTADDTAAAAANQFAAAKNGGTPAASAVLLASDAEYQDALSASYLENVALPAQHTNGTSVTGGSTYNPLLLNPYDAPNGGESATAAANEIRKLGAGTVYIIGGTDAISQDVQTQLSQTQIGTNANGSPVYLQVVRIAGVTAEQTASMVAQYPSAGASTKIPATPGAYGMYNSGASESTSGPTSSPVTAILADANEFQDALASSPLASAYNVPVLLTPGGQGLDSNAAAAIDNLHVNQVIIVGGSDAVSDQVVTQLEGMGVSVLRIAGTTFDATANELAQFETNDYQAPNPSSSAPTTVDGLDSAAKSYTGDSLTVGTSRGDAYQDALSSSQVLGEGGVGLVDPLLLNDGTSTLSTGTAAFLTSHGTAPNGTFVVYTAPTSTTNTTGTPMPESVLGDVVFGGSLAQTPALVQSELNDIAAG